MAGNAVGEYSSHYHVTAIGAQPQIGVAMSNLNTSVFVTLTINGAGPMEDWIADNGDTESHLGWGEEGTS